MTRKRELATQSILVMAAQALTILIGIANNAVLARLLPQHELGSYQLVLAWSTVAAIGGLPGMNTPVLKSVLKGNDGFYWVATRESLRSAACATLLLVIGAIAIRLVDAEFKHASNVALLVAASIPIAGIQNYDSVLIGKRQFSKSRFVQLASALAVFLSTSLAATLSRDFSTAFLGYLLGRTAITLAAFRIVSKQLKSAPLDHEANRELLKHGWRQTFLNVLILVSSRLDRLLLGSINPTLLAQYHIGTLIPANIKGNAKTVLGVLATHWGQLTGNGNAKAVARSSALLFGGGAACFLISAASLPLLIPPVFGQEYASAIPLGIMFSLTLIPVFFNYMVGLENQIQNDGRFNQRAQIARHAFQATGLFVFAHRGVTWIIATILLSETLFTLLSWLYMKRKNLTRESN